MSAILEEHIGYLKLPHRARLYRDAISAVVQPDDVVVDLGCGLGVLGIECLKAGASHVFGIDRSDAIELAREAICKAGLTEKYSCIRESTFRTELTEKADVIICDHVGFFGFDYGIIAMLADARERLLKPGGKIIPSDLSLVIAGVSSDRASALIDIWEKDPVPAEYGWLREHAANSTHSHAFAASDLCSPSSILGQIDFASVDGEESFAFNAEIAIERDCRLDGIVGCFDCTLSPDVSMTNSPLNPMSIGRDQLFLPAKAPIMVKKGDIVKVSIRADPLEKLITWTIAPTGGTAQTMSTWKSRVLTQQDLLASNGGPLSLNNIGQARQVVLQYVDGKRSAEEIEQTVISNHPELHPSRQEISRFVRRELGQATD